jgi:hypothetical protein
MTKKEFLNAVSNGKEDVIQIVLDALADVEADYCIIGGLAVNAYAEPVVSLDLDVIVVAEKTGAVCKTIEGRFEIERFAHSINLSTDKSDLRIQLQTDARYQDFISRAANKTVLGYEMKVASVEDVLQGKVWAYSDEEQRKSKRQKDLADIVRLVEEYPYLNDLIPESIKRHFE